MRNTIGLAGLFVAAALITGCAEERDEYYEDYNMRSDRLLTDPYRTTYPTVPGHTTGAGTPVDKRTGGEITGRDVTPREQLESGQNVPGDQTPGAVRPADTPYPVGNRPVDAERINTEPIDADQP